MADGNGKGLTDGTERKMSNTFVESGYIKIKISRKASNLLCH